MNETRIDFNPVPAAQRVARWHGLIRTRLLSFGISVAIAVVIGLWQWKNFSTFAWTLLIVLTLVPLAWVAGGLVMLQVAKRDLAAVQEGEALAVSPAGLRVGGHSLAWNEVATITTRSGGPFRSPALIVKPIAGEKITLPADYLSAPVGDIDNAVRVYSRNRHRVDLTGFGV